MWQFLRTWLNPPKPVMLSCVLDFTKPTNERWARFEGGDNFDAHFTVRGFVAKGDEILVRMCSGRVGRYCLFSVLRDFSSRSDWKVRGCATGYQGMPRTYTPFRRPIKGLLGPAPRSLQPNPSQPLALSCGFTDPASEFWKILARNEACCARADKLRATGDLRFGSIL
jgi:hypothetical protein